jgi:hypothetical protein
VVDEQASPLHAQTGSSLRPLAPALESNQSGRLACDKSFPNLGRPKNVPVVSFFIAWYRFISPYHRPRNLQIVVSDGTMPLHKGCFLL